MNKICRVVPKLRDVLLSAMGEQSLETHEAYSGRTTCSAFTRVGNTESFSWQATSNDFISFCVASVSSNMFLLLEAWLAAWLFCTRAIFFFSSCTKHQNWPAGTGKVYWVNWNGVLSVSGNVTEGLDSRSSLWMSDCSLLLHFITPKRSTASING